MTADLSDPKVWAIGGIFYAVCLLMLWKFQFGESSINLTGIKIAISIVIAPIIMLIIYYMGSD